MVRAEEAQPKTFWIQNQLVYVDVKPLYFKNMMFKETTHIKKK